MQAARDVSDSATVTASREDFRDLFHALADEDLEALLHDHVRQKLKIMMLAGGQQTISTMLAAFDIFAS